MVSAVTRWGGLLVDGAARQHVLQDGAARLATNTLDGHVGDVTWSPPPLMAGTVALDATHTATDRRRCGSSAMDGVPSAVAASEWWPRHGGGGRYHR